MNNIISLMGSTESGGIFGVLGIDWKILILQAVAFGLLVFILAKWVYPPILKMLNAREKFVEDSVKAAKEANQKSADAEEAIAKQLDLAKKDAADIVAAAREQSNQMILDGEKEAGVRADNIVASAREQLSRDVEAARKMLRNDTVELVANASGVIIREKVDASKDSSLIETAIKESEKSSRKEKA